MADSGEDRKKAAQAERRPDLDRVEREQRQAAEKAEQERSNR